MLAGYTTFACGAGAGGWFFPSQMEVPFDVAVRHHHALEKSVGMYSSAFLMRDDGFPLTPPCQGGVKCEKLCTAEFLIFYTVLAGCPIEACGRRGNPTFERLK